MTTETTTEKQVECPSCGKKAKRVGAVTLRALLRQEYASGIAGVEDSSCDSSGNDASGCKPISGDSSWRFCDSQDCDVVYFSEQCDRAFTRSQLRVAVGVKETAGQRPLCYCFDHSIASIKQELQTKGHSDALLDIRAKMKEEDPGCHCQTENPSGTCCLGSVANGIKVAREELGMAVSHHEPSPPASSASNRPEKIAKIGTLVSAVVASSCCWVPLVLLAVGVSGAGIASTLETYRPLFVAVTVGFLGAAFYFTYRPRNATSDEDCCAPAAKGRFSMMTFNKAMLWVVTVLAIAFLFFPSYVGALIGGGNATTVTDNMNRANITIEGMTCEGCSALVAKAIGSVPGVLAVEVGFEKGRAVVGTQIGRAAPTQEILTALDEAGYTGTIAGSEETTALDAEGTPACCVVPDQEQSTVALLWTEDDVVQAKPEVAMLQVLSEDAHELRTAFNEHVGDARVILLASPG